MGVKHVNPGLRFFVGMAGGKYHAFADAKLHFSWSQVRDHHRVFADQVGGFVGAGDAAENVACFCFAHVQRQPQQLGRTFHRFAIDDERDAQVDFGEVVNRDAGGDSFAPRFTPRFAIVSAGSGQG